MWPAQEQHLFKYDQAKERHLSKYNQAKSDISPIRTTFFWMEPSWEQDLSEGNKAKNGHAWNDQG
jgi:hypothetical protein